MRENIVEAFRKLGISFNSFHAPYIDDGRAFQKGSSSWLDNIFDLTEESPRTMACLFAHMQIIGELTDVATDKVLIAHPLPASPYKSEKEILESISRVVKNITPWLEDHNIYLAIENMPWLKKQHARYTPFLGGVSFFERLLHETNHPNVGLTFDWGHANSYARYMYTHGNTIEGFDFLPGTLARFEYQSFFLRKLKEKIYHLHIHYNKAHDLDETPPFWASNFDYHGSLTGLSEEEYPRYKANLDIIKNSTALKSITIEVFPLSSLFHTRSRLKKYQTDVEILHSMLQ